jgi:DNA-binding winged helix-turn-helix (wHTH) protein
MLVHVLFGAFELDEARFELRRRAQPVPVQPKVLDLILHLARHRERFVSKEELLDALWSGVSVSEASLSQAVSLARRALDDTAEAQHTIRTVRGKGFQFVAECRRADEKRSPALTAHSRPRVEPRRAAARPASTAMETAQASVRTTATTGEAPHLFAALHCESPTSGGASWSLGDVDEVLVGRGSERRSERSSVANTRVLTLSFPGQLMSRRHARIIRTPVEWLVVDLDSRNGTFVNGERVHKTTLAPGDILECGRTLLLLSTERIPAGNPPAADSRELSEALLPTVTPAVAAIARDLGRLATSDLPILFAGESGVGKTHVAHAVHAISGRRGLLVALDAAAMAVGGDGATAMTTAMARARNGTLLLENVDRIPESMFASLASAIDTASDVRLLCTSTRALVDVERRLPADLLARVSGFHCALPPLRERRGDLGVLVGALLAAAGRASVELDTAAGRALLMHPWPGNLRELGRAIEVATKLADGNLIGSEHLADQLRTRPADANRSKREP